MIYDLTFNIALFFIIVILIALILYFIYTIYTKLKEHFEKRVAETSSRYKATLELNNNYKFNEIRNPQLVEKRLNSKQQFDRFNFDKFFASYVEKKLEYYTNLIVLCNENKDKLTEYREKYSTLPQLLTKDEIKTLKLPFNIYRRTEALMTKAVTLNPVTAPTVKCKIYYTSPKGQNSYKNCNDYSFSDIIKYCDLASKQLEVQSTKEYQRKLMTSAMRYSILNRDNQRCVICGRSASDGVTLQVDHIIPVSKGGKTTPENLRTLCSDCNLGKGDKYNPDGIN